MRCQCNPCFLLLKIENLAFNLQALFIEPQRQQCSVALLVGHFLHEAAALLAQAQQILISGLVVGRHAGEEPVAVAVTEVLDSAINKLLIQLNAFLNGLVFPIEQTDIPFG